MHLRNCYGFWLICYDALAHSLRTAEMLLFLADLLLGQADLLRLLK